MTIAVRQEGAVAQHVARVAARLFAAQGYDATPVRAIVEAAGVTKPTLYYHFGSKEGLAQALLTKPMTRLVETQRAILEQSTDAVATLEQVLEADFAFCREDPDRARFVFALFFGPLGSGLSAELARFTHALDELLAEAAGRAAEAGLIPSQRVADFATALRGLDVVHTLKFLYAGGSLGPELPQRLVGDLLHGFGQNALTSSPTPPPRPARSRARA